MLALSPQSLDKTAAVDLRTTKVGCKIRVVAGKLLAVTGERFCR